jgi:hypothetical protein
MPRQSCTSFQLGLSTTPGHGGVEIGDELGVRLGIDDRHQLGNLGDLGEILAFAEIVVGPATLDQTDPVKVMRHSIDQLKADIAKLGVSHWRQLRAVRKDLGALIKTIETKTEPFAKKALRPPVHSGGLFRNLQKT